jgi:DNA modification methylase
MTDLSPARRNAPLRIEYRATTALKPMPGAPRKHPASQVRMLAKSIEAFGFNVPILVDGEDRIVAGHARVTAAGRCGMTELPAVRIEHLNETQLKAFTLADNRLAELARWDDQLLGTILLELSELDLDFDIEATGFSVAEIDLRIEGLGDTTAGPEELPVSSGPPVVQSGELWAMGDHTLLCGNALDEASWKSLMGDERAALVVTDPPYNVPIGGHVSGLGQHRHREFAMAVGEMNEAEFTAFLANAMRHAHAWSVPGSVHFWAMDWRHVGEIANAGRRIYERFLNMCVWQKSAPGMGSFYRSQHELFFVFAKGGASSRNNVQLGRFGRSRSNVWTYPGAASLARTSEEGNPLAMHPTVKPLALVCDILLDASARGDIIADPFAGSGTSVIAAEKLGRKARVIELDPAYGDTIIRRWRNWTGEDAVRIADGMTYASVEREIEAAEAAAQAGEVA